MIEQNCAYCGKLFLARRYEVIKGRAKYCSHVCHGKATAHRGEKCYLWRGGETQRNCLFCGKSFTVSRNCSREVQVRKLFCSPMCYHSWQKKESLIERVCLNCGKVFYRKRGAINQHGGKFCSLHCFYTSGYHKDIHRRVFQENPWIQKRGLLRVHIKPNRSELSLQKILDKNFSGEWKYTGDGTHIIGGFPVDFTNCNGRKAVIELFGEYWHTKKIRSWHQTELGRIMAFNSLGFKCLVIWAHELKDEKAVVDKVSQFMKVKRH